MCDDAPSAKNDEQPGLFPKMEHLALHTVLCAGAGEDEKWAHLLTTTRHRNCRVWRMKWRLGVTGELSGSRQRSGKYALYVSTGACPRRHANRTWRSVTLG